VSTVHTLTAHGVHIEIRAFGAYLMVTLATHPDDTQWVTATVNVHVARRIAQLLLEAAE
jgi:hypothetical protein